MRSPKLPLWHSRPNSFGGRWPGFSHEAGAEARSRAQESRYVGCYSLGRERNRTRGPRNAATDSSGCGDRCRHRRSQFWTRRASSSRRSVRRQTCAQDFGLPSERAGVRCRACVGVEVSPEWRCCSSNRVAGPRAGRSLRIRSPSHPSSDRNRPSGHGISGQSRCPGTHHRSPRSRSLDARVL